VASASLQVVEAEVVDGDVIVRIIFGREAVKKNQIQPRLWESILSRHLRINVWGKCRHVNFGLRDFETGISTLKLRSALAGILLHKKRPNMLEEIIASIIHSIHG
jgi:hypothetical protein